MDSADDKTVVLKKREKIQLLSISFVLLTVLRLKLQLKRNLFKLLSSKNRIRAGGDGLSSSMMIAIVTKVTSSRDEKTKTVGSSK